MSDLLDDERLDWALLNAYGFDRPRFETALARIRSMALTTDSATITEPIEPVDGVADIRFDDEDTRRLGDAAISAGKLACVVLNGGMATRFGGVVKGTVEVFDGLSFMALKARDVARASERSGGAIPFVLMNSFATVAGTKAHIEATGHFGLDAALVSMFSQSISIRMTLDAELFIGDDGRPSYHAPGHGDFFACIRSSGVLGALRDRGVEYIQFSNVDNLGATIDASILGHHIRAGAAMTAEVTQKRRTASGAWDKGGAPARVAGRKQLVEGFRFPTDLAPDYLPDFSTNNVMFSVDAIDRELPLERHLVEKSVDGRPVLQLESITCEASGLYDGDEPLLQLELLRVPRDGPHGRFYPIKERGDLDSNRDALRRRLG